MHKEHLGGLRTGRRAEELGHGMCTKTVVMRQVPKPEVEKVPKDAGKGAYPEK
jgi:hypothetical protein